MVLEFSERLGVSGWRYGGDELLAAISLPEFPRGERVTVEITWSEGYVGNQGLPDGVRGTIARLKRVMPMINNHWPAEWAPEAMIAATQTGNRIGLKPESTAKELQALFESYPAILDAVESLEIPDTTKTRVLGHLAGLQN